MRDITRTHGLSTPGAVTAALWLQAWLDGQAGSDDLLSMLAWVAPDTPVGLQEPDATHAAESLLQRIRARQPVQAWPVLPRPGRTLGWPATVPGDPSPSVLLVAGPSIAQRPAPEARLLMRAGSSGWILDDLRDPSPGAPARPNGSITALPDLDSTDQLISTATAESLSPERPPDASPSCSTRRPASSPSSGWNDLRRSPGRTGGPRPSAGCPAPSMASSPASWHASRWSSTRWTRPCARTARQSPPARRGAVPASCGGSTAS